MFDSIRKFFGGRPAPAPSRPLPPPPPEADEVEVTVPEMSVAALRQALEGETRPLILDVREEYEWRQVHLPTDQGMEVLHIPMNSVPERLGELPRGRTVAVMCAHGNRSYGVTHYLREQGFDAHNLSGGITRWTQAGGPVAR